MWRSPFSPISPSPLSTRGSGMPFAVLDILRRVGREPMGLFGLSLVVIVLTCALLAPLIAPYDPAHIDVLHKFGGFSMSHWLGTDQLGRDTLSRFISCRMCWGPW